MIYIVYAVWDRKRSSGVTGVHVASQVDQDLLACAVPTNLNDLDLYITYTYVNSSISRVGDIFLGALFFISPGSFNVWTRRWRSFSMMAADDRSVLPRTFVTGAMLDLMSFLSKDGDKFPQNFIKNFIDGGCFKTVWWSFRWRRWPLALPNWLNTVPKVWFSDAFLLCGSGWNLKRSRLVVFFPKPCRYSDPKNAGFHGKSH